MSHVVAGGRFFATGASGGCGSYGVVGLKMDATVAETVIFRFRFCCWVFSLPNSFSGNYSSSAQNFPEKRPLPKPGPKVTRINQQHPHNTVATACLSVPLLRQARHLFATVPHVMTVTALRNACSRKISPPQNLFFFFIQTGVIYTYHRDGPYNSRAS